MKRRSFLRIGGLTAVAATVPTLAFDAAPRPAQAERVQPASVNSHSGELKREILKYAIPREVLGI